MQIRVNFGCGSFDSGGRKSKDRKGRAALSALWTFTTFLNGRQGGT